MTSAHPSPPATARRLLARCLPREDRAWLLAELDDLYAARVRERGEAAARRWYLRQIPGFSFRLLADRLRRAGATLTDPRFLREATHMDAYLADFRYALRRLVRTPLFTAVAILSLALGIGANTAIFSLVNAVLLKGQPFSDPHELVELYTSESDGYPYATTSYLDFRAMKDETALFDGVVGTRTFLARFEQGERPELAFGELVSGDYFDVLGIPMALGRSFRPEEDATPGTHPVVIVGYRTWTSEYGGDPGILGETVVLNGHPFTVVGVAGEAFTGTVPVVATAFFAPLMMTNELMGTMLESQLERRGSRSMFVKARLRDGVTVEQVNHRLAALSAGIAEAYPESNEARVFSALPSGEVSLHPLVDRALVPVAGLLLAVVGIVLLIACANLASFLLARAEDRRKEIALRLALGAGRARLVRQLLVETLVLAGLGGVAGAFMAQWTLGLVLSFKPPIPIPVDFAVPVDGNVLAFTALVSVVAGIAFGLAPALQATRPELAPTLKDEAGGAGKPGRFSLRGALVVTQVAFSFLLLIGAGLFVRSLQKAQAVDPGFYTGPAAMVWPLPELSGYETPAEVAALTRTLEERLLAHPLIGKVAVADRLPLGAEIQTRGVLVPGMPSESPNGAWDVDNTTVMPGYFETMEVPIVRGRGFTREDLEGENVVVVSQAFAERFFPGEDPVGRTVSYPGNTGPWRIVGVARDTKVRTLGESPRPYLYQVYRPEVGLGMQFVVMGNAPAPELLATAREVLDQVDPDLVLFGAKTMNEHLALMLFPPRMAAFLLTVFGGLALILSAIGIYGVVSYAVAKRTREMGIRISLGASARDVVAKAVGGGMRLVLIGAAVGIVLAAGLTWLISGYLYGISSTDVVTFVAIPVLLTGVALVAALVPARRAARVDPVRALRAE
ncbi:MAG TPA: ADOP family duplicated permease [Longimicrobiales bacterium]|nr:ADOP family duplicated permease [Longimicrobiales bacterium]